MNVMNKVGRLDKAISALVVNHKTLSLIRRCIDSLMAAYPDMPITVIDNGSHDESTEYIREAATVHSVTAVFNDTNVGHGPALDQGMRAASTKHVFTLDSDCIVLRSSFLEKMLDILTRDDLYAIGWLMHVNERGVSANPWDYEHIPYIHPSAALIDREKYLGLEPFIWHGAPAICNMADARRLGYRVAGFPIDGYVLHIGRGTRNAIDVTWHGEGK